MKKIKKFLLMNLAFIFCLFTLCGCNKETEKNGDIQQNSNTSNDNSQNSEDLNSTNKMKILDNFTDNDSESDSYIIPLTLYEDDSYSESSSSYTLNLYCSFGGKDKGKIVLGVYDNEIKKVIDPEKSIKDCFVSSIFVSSTSTERISALNVLFEDGTISRITTTDIKNNNFKLTQLNEYKNIDYFITLKQGNYASDSDTVRFAVDYAGKMYKFK